MIKRIQQLGRPGWSIGEPVVEGDRLRIPIQTPSGEVVETYDLSQVGPDPVPGSELATGPTPVCALARAYRDGEELHLAILDWSQPEPEPQEGPDGG